MKSQKFLKILDTFKLLGLWLLEAASIFTALFAVLLSAKSLQLSMIIPALWYGLAAITFMVICLLIALLIRFERS